MHALAEGLPGVRGVPLWGCCTVPAHWPAAAAPPAAMHIDFVRPPLACLLMQFLFTRPRHLSFIHSIIHSFMHFFIHSFVRSCSLPLTLMCSFPCSPNRLFKHAFTPVAIQSCTHTPAALCTHLLVQSRSKLLFRPAGFHIPKSQLIFQ